MQEAVAFGVPCQSARLPHRIPVRDPLGARTSQDGVDPGEIHTFIFPAAVNVSSFFFKCYAFRPVASCFYIVYQQYTYIFILFRSTSRVDRYECLFITILKISKYCQLMLTVQQQLAGAKLRKCLDIKSKYLYSATQIDSI